MALPYVDDLEASKEMVSASSTQRDTQTHTETETETCVFLTLAFLTCTPGWKVNAMLLEEMQGMDAPLEAKYLDHMPLPKAMQFGVSE